MHARGLSVRIGVETDMDGGTDIEIAANVFLPQHLPEANAIVLFCFSGGGMTQLYFDLEGSSFAQAMAAERFFVVTLDHACIGRSTGPRDAFQLTARRLAAIGAAAVQKLSAGLRTGALHRDIPRLPDLTPVGVGHSMGAMLVTLQQAAFRPYAALALLGFSTRGLPEVLTPAEQAEAKRSSRDDAYYIQLARQRFGGQALAEIPSRRDGSAALTAAAAPLLTVAAMQSMLPGNIAPEAAAIDAPLFLAVGDRDITGRPEAIGPRFPMAPDKHMLVLENTGHHPFIGPAAGRLYAELAAWVIAKSYAA